MNSKAKTQKYIVVTIEELASSFPRLADPELTRLEVATGMGEPWEGHGFIGWERECGSTGSPPYTVHELP